MSLRCNCRRWRPSPRSGRFSLILSPWPLLPLRCTPPFRRQFCVIVPVFHHDSSPWWRELLHDVDIQSGSTPHPKLRMLSTFNLHRKLRVDKTVTRCHGRAVISQGYSRAQNRTTAGLLYLLSTTSRRSCSFWVKARALATENKPSRDSDVLLLLGCLHRCGRTGCCIY
ncbi:hypothetical protein EJ06DRAFT_345866 [Trichodelitschia bisporula]|uniref:Uncharacterized protein n=1 Tax=Trichodelitschia bisporula TaxID=703511 RepID=A0A6G1I364_9PEZI|nr:hypothetical protein EJ06DRAFT_345866 [Trichodelitschia bisporula]